MVAARRAKATGLPPELPPPLARKGDATAGEVEPQHEPAEEVQPEQPVGFDRFWRVVCGDLEIRPRLPERDDSRDGKHRSDGHSGGRAHSPPAGCRTRIETEQAEELGPHTGTVCSGI